METRQFDICIENPKLFELWAFIPSFLHAFILYTFITIFYIQHSCSYSLQMTKTIVPRLLIPLQRGPQHTSSHAHINCHAKTNSPVCRTQSSFSFSVSLASLFACLLFTYILRRLGIPALLACLLTRCYWNTSEWRSQSLRLLTRWKKPLGFRSGFDMCPVWPCIV